MTHPFAWPYVLRVPVRFGDLDAMGHVNNAVYLTYLEQARNQAYLDLRGWEPGGDLEEGLDFVVARAEVDFVLPVHFGDVMEVRITPERVGRSSFTWSYDVRRADGKQCMRARTVLVAYDWTQRSSKPLDPTVAAAIRSGCAEGDVSA